MMGGVFEENSTGFSSKSALECAGILAFRREAVNSDAVYNRMTMLRLEVPLP